MYSQALLRVSHELNLLGLHLTNLSSCLSSNTISRPRNLSFRRFIIKKCMNHKEFWQISLPKELKYVKYLQLSPFLTNWGFRQHFRKGSLVDVLQFLFKCLNDKDPNIWPVRHWSIVLFHWVALRFLSHPVFLPSSSLFLHKILMDKTQCLLCLLQNEKKCTSNFESIVIEIELIESS